jgi:hypothetical protein
MDNGMKINEIVPYGISAKYVQRFMGETEKPVYGLM